MLEQPFPIEYISGTAKDMFGQHYLPLAFLPIDTFLTVYLPSSANVLHLRTFKRLKPPTTPLDALSELIDASRNANRTPDECDNFSIYLVWRVYRPLFASAILQRGHSPRPLP